MKAFGSDATPDPLPPRILVVDDDAHMCEYVARVMEGAGYRVTTAPHAAGAIETVAAQGPPDLLLTDLKMPQMNGDELAARLRQSTPDLKVLYLTGFSQALFSTRTQLWEGEAFLEKPCAPAALLEGVSLLLFDCLAPTASGVTEHAASLRSLLGGLARNPRKDVV
jgi:two-component system cell cycle sensor histidine kinase/response regulator CckA